MTPRRAARTDSNHAEIREAARLAGYQWFDTFRLGDGFPDGLCVSKSGIPVLIEVKSEKGSYTPDEETFVNNYRGPYCLITSAEELLIYMAKWDNWTLARMPGWY